MAEGDSGTGNKLMNGAKTAFNGVGKFVKPALIGVAFFSIFAVVDGGLSATLAAGGAKTQALAVPAEGVSEFTNRVAEVGGWVSDKASALAPTPAVG